MSRGRHAKRRDAKTHKKHNVVAVVRRWFYFAHTPPSPPGHSPFSHSFLTVFFLQIRTRLRSGLWTRTSDLATRRDQPRHTRAGVQDRGRRRAATGARAGALPSAGHQDRGVPGREARAVPGGQAVRGAHWEEGARARRQTVPRAGVQDQAHLPRAQMDQVAQRLVNGSDRRGSDDTGKNARRVSGQWSRRVIRVIIIYHQ